MKEESDYDCKLCTHLCLTGHLGSAPEERSTQLYSITNTKRALKTAPEQCQ